MIDKKFVISRVLHENNDLEIAYSRTHLQAGDKLFIIAAKQDMDAIIAFIGEKIEMHRSEWEKLDSKLVSKRIMITRSEINGKMLAQLHLRGGFGVNITRVNRAGVDLVASPGLELQIGDRVTVVGTEDSVKSVEKILGNSLRSFGYFVREYTFYFSGNSATGEIGIGRRTFDYRYFDQ